MHKDSIINEEPLAHITHQGSETAHGMELKEVESRPEAVRGGRRANRRMGHKPMTITHRFKSYELHADGSVYYRKPNGELRRVKDYALLKEIHDAYKE